MLPRVCDGLLLPPLCTGPHRAHVWLLLLRAPLPVHQPVLLRTPAEDRSPQRGGRPRRRRRLVHHGCHDILRVQSSSLFPVPTGRQGNRVRTCTCRCRCTCMCGHARTCVRACLRTCTRMCTRMCTAARRCGSMRSAPHESLCGCHESLCGCSGGERTRVRTGREWTAGQTRRW